MRRRQALLAAAGFLVVILGLLGPLLPRFGSAIIGPAYGDGFEVLWQLDWLKKAVFELGVSPFYAPGLYYPQGWYLASGAQPSWFLLLLSPAAAVLGVPVTYNLSLVTATLLAALGVWWFVRDLTGDSLAGFVAGCAYILAPVFSMRLAGHFHTLLGLALLPYAAHFFYWAMEGDEDDPRMPLWIALSGLALAATILCHWYFLFIAPLPLIGLVLFTPSKAAAVHRIGRAALIGLIALIGVAPFAGLTMEARAATFPDGQRFTVSQSTEWGISPDYLVAPNLLHPLAPTWSRTWPMQSEADSVSLGYGALLLAAVGLLSWPGHRTRPFVVVGLIALLLGLGLWLRWRGQLVTLVLPTWAEQSLARWLVHIRQPDGSVAVPLPGLALYLKLPFYGSMRVWSRFAGPLMWAVVVLAGMGAATLMARGRAGKAAVLLLGVLVLAEGIIPVGRMLTPLAVHDRQADAWLAGLPSDTTVIEYPRPTADLGAMISQSIHGRRIVNGYMSVEPQFLQETGQRLGRWPGPEALPILREWGVDYVLVSAKRRDPAFQVYILPRIASLDGLCLIRRFDDAFLNLGRTYAFALVEPGTPCPPSP